MAVDKIKYFEARNPQISVNVFGWNGSIFPLKNIREEKECHVDLILLTKEFKSHYCLVAWFPLKLYARDMKDFSAKDASIHFPAWKV